jgi:mono/diheme cytochrome c family protein
MTATPSARTTRLSDRFDEDAPRPWKPLAGSGFREVARSAAVGLVLSLLVTVPGGWTIYGEYAERERTQQALRERVEAHVRLVAAPAAGMLPLDPVVHGKGLFETTCAACHKADGTGLPGLGKDLTSSWFVAATDDEALRRFVHEGRSADDPLNTTRIPMPPKGGHPELTDADVADIVVYVRGLQDPRRMPELPASALAVAVPVRTRRRVVR